MRLVFIKLMDERISLDDQACDRDIAHHGYKRSDYHYFQYQEDERIPHNVLHLYFDGIANHACRPVFEQIHHPVSAVVVHFVMKN